MLSHMQYSQAAAGPWLDDARPEPVPPIDPCYPAYGVPEGPANGDFVRAVSDLPLCLQPVFAGSFRYQCRHAAILSSCSVVPYMSCVLNSVCV